MSRLARALCATVVCLLALAGCASLADLGELQTTLEDAGYDVSNINHNTNNGHAVLSVAAVSEEGATEDVDRIAELVWTTFPGEFDELAIVLNGAPALVASADELAEKFGERPAGLADEAEEDGGSNVVVVVAILVGAALLAGIFVLVWRNGRRPPRGPVPPQYPPGGYPYAPQQYPPPQYPPQYPPQQQ